jgi:hypothetical protein
VRALTAALALLCACAPTSAVYVPRVVAKDELTADYDGHRFAVWARGGQVARGLGWRGLTRHVRCVPPAKAAAETAERAGARAIAFSVVGGVLGGGSLTAFAAFASPRVDVRVGVLLGGVALAAIGTVFAALAYRDKNVSNGSAFDAMNYFNDAVGSYGASCDSVGPGSTVEPTDTPASQPGEPSSQPRNLVQPLPAEKTTT